MRLLFLIGIPIIIFRAIQTHHIPSSLTVDSYAGKKVIITGTIISEPEHRSSKSFYVMEADQIYLRDSKTTIFPVHGKIRITDRRGYPRYTLNQIISAAGTLHLPDATDDFRYDLYLDRFGIHSVISRARIKLIKSSQPTWRSLLYRYKSNLEQKIGSLYSDPHAALLSGLLIGTRQDIPKDLMETFSITGLTHIIAISGYNISLIIILLNLFVWWMPRVMRLVIMTIFICVFVLLTGASASVVRAAIMGILGLLAFTTGRRSDALTAITLTGILMLIHNPKLLWADASFQLSFAAVLGLLYLTPILKHYSKRLPDLLFIKDAAIMTIAAQIATAPLIAMLFGRISLIAPIANIAVALAIPLIMILGPLSLVIPLLALPTFGCLHWIILTAQVLERVPWASMEIELNLFGMILSYFFLIKASIYLHSYTQTFLPPTSLTDVGSRPGIEKT